MHGAACGTLNLSLLTGEGGISVILAEFAGRSLAISTCASTTIFALYKSVISCFKSASAN